MKETQLIKNVTLISTIMLIIHFIGIIYQLFMGESIPPILLKLVYVFLFTTLIIMTYKKHKLFIIISILITIYSIILATMYFDFFSILISIVLLYYSYNLYISLKSNTNITDIKNKIK